MFKGFQKCSEVFRGVKKCSEVFIRRCSQSRSNVFRGVGDKNRVNPHVLEENTDVPTQLCLQALTNTRIFLTTRAIQRTSFDPIWHFVGV